MRSLNHIHTLVRMNKIQRKCLDKYCGFVCDNEWARGKASLCGICGVREVIMDSVQMKLAKPRCDNCSERREVREKRSLVNKLERLGLS